MSPLITITHEGRLISQPYILLYSATSPLNPLNSLLTMLHVNYKNLITNGTDLLLLRCFYLSCHTTWVPINKPQLPKDKSTVLMFAWLSCVNPFPCIHGLLMRSYWPVTRPGYLEK